MKVEELAIEYFETIQKRGEKRRYIDFDMKRNLENLVKNSATPNDSLEVTKFRNEINNEEDLFYQLQQDAAYQKNELLPVLLEIGTTRDQPLSVHIKNDTYIDLYVDDNSEIITFGYYSKMN